MHQSLSDLPVLLNSDDKELCVCVFADHNYFLLLFSIVLENYRILTIETCNDVTQFVISCACRPHFLSYGLMVLVCD